jgi:hypothetical protein
VDNVRYIRALRAMLRTAATIVLRECDKVEAASLPKRKACSRSTAPKVKRRGK